MIPTVDCVSRRVNLGQKSFKVGQLLDAELHLLETRHGEQLPDGVLPRPDGGGLQQRRHDPVPQRPVIGQYVIT